MNYTRVYCLFRSCARGTARQLLMIAMSAVSCWKYSKYHLIFKCLHNQWWPTTQELTNVVIIAEVCHKSLVSCICTCTCMCVVYLFTYRRSSAAAVGLRADPQRDGLTRLVHWHYCDTCPLSLFDCRPTLRKSEATHITAKTRRVWSTCTLLVHFVHIKKYLKTNCTRTVLVLWAQEISKILANWQFCATQHRTFMPPS